MAKREWIGNYILYVEEYQSYKNKWVKYAFNLGKCLGEDEAIERAVALITREFATEKIRDVYIVNGWGNIIYM